MNPEPILALGDLQETFQDYLLSPRPDHAVRSEIVGDERAGADFRLQIYAEAYRLRLEEALETDFEILHTLLGDQQFHELCLRYIAAHPSAHYSLRYFGRSMSDFLRVTAPYAAQGVLAELAAFEWSLIDAFDAPDAHVVTRQDMAKRSPQDWPQLCLQFHASVQQMQFNWNAAQIWAAIKNQQIPPAPQRLEPSASWLVWRQDYQSYYRPLNAAEALAMEGARAGKNFAELCEALCAQVEEAKVAAAAAGFLQRWIGDGLVQEVFSAAAT